MLRRVGVEDVEWGCGYVVCGGGGWRRLGDRFRRVGWTFWLVFWKVEKRRRTYYAPVRCISKWLDMWSCMKAWTESEVGSLIWHVGTHRDILGRFSGHWFCEVVAILDAHFLGRR